MSHLPLWYMGEIPTVMCDKMLEEFAESELKSGSMGAEGESSDLNQRNTSVTFTEFDHWFATLLEAHAYAANSECKWDYEINQRESVQVAKYGVDQHYGWHVDVFPLAGNPIDRKITVVCLLNDPTEYEGGELQLRLYQEYTAPLKKGSLIAFPSIIEQRVTPVLKGTRYSATLWTAGPRFK